MVDFTVALFGHREVPDLSLLESKLVPIITELIRTNPYTVFMIGRNGEFDEYTASVIKRLQREYGKENSEITLILPYEVANIDCYEKYYDGIVIPESVCGAHFKSAITLRNRWMVEKADLILGYVERDRGGAYAAIKYAEKLGKRVINLSKISEN